MSDSALAERLSELHVGEPIHNRALTVFPLVGPDRPGPEYVLAADAIGSGGLAVEEVGEQGVVGTLEVTNTGDLPVLLLDGEVLVGAKQNRTVNTTILLAARTTTKIPVSCVERGRWRHGGRVSPSEHISPHRVRSSVRRSVSRSLRESGSHRSDQGDVWARVDGTLSGAASHSMSDDLVQAYRDREADLAEFEEPIRPGPDWQGFVVAIRGRIVGGDVFDRSATVGKVWRKLIRAAALEAISRPGAEPGPATREGVRRVLDRAAGGRSATYPSPGLGSDLRVDDGDLQASALVTDDAVIHAGVFVTD